MSKILSCKKKKKNTMFDHYKKLNRFIIKFKLKKSYVYKFFNIFYFTQLFLIFFVEKIIFLLILNLKNIKDFPQN